MSLSIDKIIVYIEKNKYSIKTLELIFNKVIRLIYKNQLYSYTLTTNYWT